MLTFPNAARSFDDVRGRIRFLGHDGMFEVKIFVDADVVLRGVPGTNRNEHELLAAFDRMLDRVHAIAKRLYKSNARSSIMIGRADL